MGHDPHNIKSSNPGMASIGCQSTTPSPAMPIEQRGEPAPLSNLERAVSKIWASYQRSRYRSASGQLPSLIEASLAATHVYDADRPRQAITLAAYVPPRHHALPDKLGETDLAWIAASHGLGAADNSDNQIAIGSVGRAAAHALAANGDYEHARDVAVAVAANHLDQYVTSPTPALLSVYGSLHVVNAFASATDPAMPCSPKRDGTLKAEEDMIVSDGAVMSRASSNPTQFRSDAVPRPEHKRRTLRS